ncbi:MAG: hypothetical protein QOJ13_596 [Gaiellales bacterium]|jgi:hypothetical protein|nr:hypothetical protein [Gaiellales bacterium]MDX6591400.1 hypothetical protein [Gaiellales bacterium]
MDPQDRERHKQNEEPDVEAHRRKHLTEDAPKDETEKDEPDVEAHRIRHI